MNCSELDRAMRDLAEIGSSASTAHDFRRAALERVNAAVGVDVAAMNYSPDGRHIEVSAWGVAGEALQESVAGYTNELSVAEWRRAIRPSTVSDSDILSPARKGHLRLYRDFLSPLGIASFRARVVLNQHGLSWMTFARSGRVCAEFDATATRALDGMTSILALGEALHAHTGKSRGVVADRLSWAKEYGITKAEYAVLELVERGLTTPEIGSLLGSSPNTIRNQTAAIFRKLRVSTRAELAYVLGNVGRAVHPHADQGGSVLEDLFGPRHSDVVVHPYHGSAA